MAAFTVRKPTPYLRCKARFDIPARASRRIAAYRSTLDFGDTGAPSPRREPPDILATNCLGKALYWPLFQDPARPVNMARYQFLNPGAEQYMTELDHQRAAAAALLRTEAGQDPYNRDLSDLIGELSTRSEDFRSLWAAHNVRLHHTGLKRFRHPAVGDLTLAFEALLVPTDPGLTLTAMSAEPGTSSADGLKLLSSWAATLDGNHQPDNEPTNDQGATHRP
ncbi:hypothetical protein ABZ915_34755 [Streptomyces sp. NPDC046915]|uniref:MmyB family transcriptional regulator n=1 Tax=Streptomyces sp. NPDC046915 TaxID=3155257 RepID=UPI0033F510E9